MPTEEWEEEIEILESILGEDALHYDKTNENLSIQCFINLQTKYFTVNSAVKLKENNGINPDNNEVFGQVLSYLSPVLLSCKPSEKYPVEESLASFNLNCVWLSRKELESVEKHLNSFWTMGQPVIYEMISWIQDNLLEFLNIYDEIHIPDSNEDYCCDALTRMSILDKSNRESTVKRFNLDIQECGTCFCEFPGEELNLLNCLHCYCSECLDTLINVQFNGGRYCKMNCPLCDSFIGREIVKIFMDKEKFLKWEEKFTIQSVEESAVVSFCPRCNNYAVCGDDNIGNCASCNFLFCDFCLEAWHPGNCESFVEKSDPSLKLKEVKRRKEEAERNEKLTMLMKKAFMKRCPNCKCWVMKDQGCNHMKCALCNTDFCYICGASGFYCCGAVVPQVPFDMESLNKEQQAWANPVTLVPEQVILENVILLDPELEKDITKCPKCRSKIQRINGNNHGKCAQCKTQFCFLCSSIIKGTVHFKLQGCRQHGGDVKR
ncbi:hypothetical protein ACHWQZ_G016737 [Mnemiopsis leidyi]